MASRSTRSGRRTWYSPAGRPAVALVATVVALFPLVPAAPAAAADVVVLPEGATGTMPAENPAKVSIAIGPAPGADLDSAPITAEVHQVLRNGAPLSAAGLVTATVVTPIPALELTVNTDLLPAPGAYTVRLSLAQGAGKQLITVTLNWPPGQLVAPATLTLQRTLPLLPGDDADISKPRLTVRAGPASRIVGLSDHQVEPDDPQIVVSTPGQGRPLGPGDHVDLPYTVTGGTDPGSVVRTVRLSSPQLSEPVPITFTVVTRRHPGLIAVALILGVLLGLVLRILLPRAAAWRARGQQRRELELQLAGLGSQYPDDGFRAFLGVQQDRLRGARGPAITEVVATVRNDVTARLQSLQAELTALDDRYRSLAEVLRPTWHLPAAFGEDLKAGRAAADAADAAITAGDAGSARDSLDTATDRTADLARRAVTWSTQLGGCLDDLRAAAGDRSKGELGNLLIAVRATEEQIPAAPASDPPTNAELGRLLRQVHITDDLLANLRTRIDAVLAEAATIVGSLRTAGQDVTGVEQAMTQVREAQHRFGTDPITAITAAAPALERLVAAELEAIRQPMKAQPDPAVDQKMGTGDMVGATGDVIDKLRSTGRTKLGSAPAAPATTPPADVAVPASTAPPGVVLAARAPLRDQLRAAPQGILLAVAGAGVLLLQTLAALAVVLLIGYGLFLPGWTGTLQDVTKVVVWAFAIDLSVAGLTALLAPANAL
ncbi:hypothetical protein [Actinoplanes subglobosus]|uniref:Uncharacterized protein n=1 Tax=Actinoplanes subglobosus TaxID=1547892 RepID=A0ABV8IY03_9ACTN